MALRLCIPSCGIGLSRSSMGEGYSQTDFRSTLSRARFSGYLICIRQFSSVEMPNIKDEEERTSCEQQSSVRSQRSKFRVNSSKTSATSADCFACESKNLDIVILVARGVPKKLSIKIFGTELYRSLAGCVSGHPTR